MHIRKMYLAGVALLALSGLGGIAGSYLEQRLHPNTANSTVSVLNPSAHANLTSQSSTNVVSALASRITPAVVNITTESTTYSFFGGPVTEQGAGTGMILTSSGYILTNNHVLPINSGTITVTTQTGKQYAAKVVATNVQEDLALVKINASNLPTVTLGDSANETVGNGVVAIGNALGQFQNTVVTGIISGTNRSVTAQSQNSMSGGESLSGLFQTDAPINPGDSGGPLIDTATGSVIGINTATSSNAQEISFAIPINEAKSFISPYLNSSMA